MKTVGLFEAKTHLSALIESVARGETVTITRHGTPVARLVPANDVPAKPPRDIVAEMKELSKGVTLGGLSIKDLINEGRKY